jgi:hypothetical protein
MAWKRACLTCFDRMQTDRLKVFANLNDWFEEFELLHRKDGVLVKERDDLMAATCYGITMLRAARTPPAPKDSYTRHWNPRRIRKKARGWQHDGHSGYRRQAICN